MFEPIFNKHKTDFDKVIEHLKFELGSIHTGRANPSLLQTVMVESYGTKMPLQQVASVTASDARTLVVTPWDKGQLGAIDKGIQAANLGFNPSNDGNVLRITLPPLSEERRKEMVKLVGQIAEKARIGVRNVREEVLKEVKKAEGSKDDTAHAQKKLQEAVDKLNGEIKSLAEAKEKEVMTV